MRDKKDSLYRYNLEKRYAPAKKKEFPAYLRKKISIAERDANADRVASMRRGLKY